MLYVLTHLVLQIILWGRYYYNSHFVDEDTEVNDSPKVTKQVIGGFRIQTRALWLWNLGS